MAKSDNINIKCDRSKFKYTLVVKPDGTLRVIDKNKKSLRSKGRKTMPPIKEIAKTRRITIMEAKEGWIYVEPPGQWYQLP